MSSNATTIARQTMQDKRHFTRVSFKAHAVLDFHSNRCKGEVVDISLKGVLIKPEETLQIQKGDLCRVIVDLPESELHLNGQAQVIHLHNGNVGLKFLSVDVETITHLRKLMGLNIGDQDKVTDELSWWLKD